MTRRWRVRSADRPTRRETGGTAKPRRMRGLSSPVPPAGGVPIPRRRQPPPTHCGAPRRNGRDLIIATRPAHPVLLSHCCQRQRRRDSFAPRRERFLCLRRPHFFQQRKKWGKERRQKLRFCTSSARCTRPWFPASSRGHSPLSPLSDKRTACTFTGAVAPATACPRHGRCFSLLPPHPQAFPSQGSRC